MIQFGQLEVAQPLSLYAQQGLQVGEAFSGLGFTFGTPGDQIFNYYLEPAFVNATVTPPALPTRLTVCR